MWEQPRDPNVQITDGARVGAGSDRCVDEPRVPARLLGLATVCWRCRRNTTALVGVLPAGELDADALITCEAEPVLDIAASLLAEPVRRAAGVGVVKARYSRTAGCWYLSNGCVWCDALIGSFFLYAEQLPAVLADKGLAGLAVLAVADLFPGQVRAVLEHGTTWAGVKPADDPRGGPSD